MNGKKLINSREYVKLKLDCGEGSYLFLMIFQDYCQRVKLNEEMTYGDWEKFLDDFGSRPTKEVFGDQI